MSWFKFSALQILISSLLFALSFSLSAEIQLPEEQYFTQMANGEIAQARASFIALIEEREAAFAAVADDHPKALALRLQRADALQRALTLWQAAETGQNLVGNAPSPEVHAKMAELGDALATCAAVIALPKGQAPEQSVVPDWLQRDAVDVSRRLGVSLVNTAAFLRDGGKPDARQRLLQEADRYIDAPATVEALDQHAGGVAKRLGVKAENFSSRPRGSKIDRQNRASGEDISSPVTANADQMAVEQARDEAIETVLQTYFEDLFAGRIFSMRALFADEYWPETEITYVMNKLSGCTLDSLGRVRVQPTSANEYLVTINSMICIDANRGHQRRKMSDQLLIRYDGDRYRISKLDAGGRR